MIVLMDKQIEDRLYMEAAINEAAKARTWASPNPWVGALVVSDGDIVGRGATEPPGGKHAEKRALEQAGEKAVGATLYTTLEPCSHVGRTGSCSKLIIESGVERVVVGIEDPDELVLGQGLVALRNAGIGVEVGVAAEEVSQQLIPYLHHRRTGLPYVVLKLAMTIDGRTAAPDGSSNWITGREARADVHRLRAESGAVCVGAGTVRADDPKLTVRYWPGDEAIPSGVNSPRRIVLGSIPHGARIFPAESYEGPLEAMLKKLGAEGVVQLLVEGGADVAGRFHRAGLVDRYVIYIAPALLGGNDGWPLMTGLGGSTIEEIQRGHFSSIMRLGDDLRLDLLINDA